MDSLKFSESQGYNRLSFISTFSLFKEANRANRLQIKNLLLLFYWSLSQVCHTFLNWFPCILKKNRTVFSSFLVSSRRLWYIRVLELTCAQQFYKCKKQQDFSLLIVCLLCSVCWQQSSRMRRFVAADSQVFEEFLEHTTKERFKTVFCSEPHFHTMKTLTKQLTWMFTVMDSKSLQVYFHSVSTWIETKGRLLAKKKTQPLRLMLCFVKQTKVT